VSLRTKLILLVALSIAVSVGAVAWLIEARTRESFRQVDAERTNALASQFRKEFEREGEEITSETEAVVNSESMLQMALEASNGADTAGYLNAAGSVASLRHLDFLDFLSPDGTILSSAHWPARFGYKERWFLDQGTAVPQQTFLHQVETPQGNALGILCLRSLKVRGSNFYVVAGRKLDAALLKSLSTPPGMRVLIYSAPEQGQGDFLSSSDDTFDSSRLMPLVQDTLSHDHEVAADIQWGFAPSPASSPDAALNSSVKLNSVQTAKAGVTTPTPPAQAGDEESFHAIPLPGFAGRSPAVLLIGNSRHQQLSLEKRIRNVSLLIALGGVLIGVIAGAIAAARITRPVQDLAHASEEIAHGNWLVHVETSSKDEIGQLARAFNHMTEELIGQRERLVQSERVAAWRELARRLAHELKNPLFPLQITVENLLRARETSPEMFEEVFQESTMTLLSEISNLKTIIGRFSDFSRMPAPELQPVDLNGLVRSVAQLFQGQLSQRTQLIETDLQLADVPAVSGDSTLLRRVIENLVLNAIDAMPAGGTLTFRTRQADKQVIFELSDTGLGLTPEECERLFTPYYTTKQHGTGLGLAIVQSVVSDHKGRIGVTSQKDEGTTFHMELPLWELGDVAFAVAVGGEV